MIKTKTNLGSRVSNAGEGVSVADEGDAAGQVLEDLLLHLPAVGGEEQVDGLVTEFEVLVPQILVQHLPALTLAIYCLLSDLSRALSPT